MEHPFIHEDLYLIKTESLVLIRKAHHDLSVSEKDLLNNILESINEKLSYAQLTSIFSEESIDDIISKYQAKRVIIFNEKNTVHEENHASGASLIYAGNLADLHSNEASKKQLWLSLKKLFLP
jgi:DNA polymerase III psi subunit